MAVEFADGVILAADSRTTTGTSRCTYYSTIGSFVFNRITDKLMKISDTIYCCKSGSAADTEAVAEIVRYRTSLHKYVIIIQVCDV